MHTPFIGAYWGVRKETREQCARRAAEFFTRIAKAHPDMGQWFQKGMSEKQARQNPVSPTFEELVRLLEVNDYNVDRSPMEDLGFSLNLWNGGSASLSINCGVFCPYVKNCVVLYFPAVDESEQEIVDALRPLLEIAIDVWDPDMALCVSFELMDETGGGKLSDTRGWLNYSKSEGTISSWRRGEAATG